MRLRSESMHQKSCHARRVRKGEFAAVLAAFRKKKTRRKKAQSPCDVTDSFCRDVYRLCTAQPKPYSERLYFAFRDFLLGHVRELAQEMRNSDADVLVDYRNRWKTYRIGMLYLNNIFRYLNNSWIKKTLDEGRNRLGGLFQSEAGGGGAAKEVHEIFTLGLLLWKEEVFDAVAKERVTQRVLEMVRLERNGERIDVDVCYQTMESIVTMGSVKKNKPLELYRDQFEVPYVNETRDYYRAESLAFVDANGVSEYMKKAEARIVEEEARSKRFLDKSSLEQMRKVVDNVLIEAHRELLQLECGNYLERATLAVSGKEVPDVSDLRRMYSLLSRVPDGVEPMLVVLKKYVVSYVTDKVGSLGKKADLPEEYCEVLLESYNLFSVTIVELAFQNSPKFVQTLDKALREVINRKSESPELLAKYCDALLRKGKNKAEAAGDLDAKLKSLITIFKYLDDKDIFQKFYSKYLARRLIYGTSVSDDSETGVLSSLKQACGYEYTTKLMRMFSDMTQGEEVNVKFQEFVAASNGTVSTEGVGFSVFVLTQGSWPLQVHKSAFNAPEEFLCCQRAFGKYYDSVHQGRRLVWLHHLGKADVRVNYLKKKYLVSVSDFQCGLLLLFNGHDEPVSWEELIAKSAMLDTEVEKTMASLVASKLIKRVGAQTERDVPGAQYDVNKSYSNKHLKFKITASVQSETDKDKKKTYKQVDDDRTMFLQALIVRIMKARKRLNHNNLLQEVIAQASSRFQPSVSLIKKQIEQLIEKEFLARQEGAAADYVYVS